MSSEAAREAARERASGRFGEQPHTDPGPAVIGDGWRQVDTVRTVDESDDDGMSTHTEAELRGDAEFRRRCRRILGVTDDTLPVVVVHSESESNPWGCETWESCEEVTVSSGGQTLTAEDLPELFRRLDAADLPRMDHETSTRLLNSGVTITALLPDGRKVTGPVANCNSWQVLIRDGSAYGCRLDFTKIIGFEEQK